VSIFMITAAPYKQCSQELSLLALQWWMMETNGCKNRKAIYTLQCRGSVSQLDSSGIATRYYTTVDSRLPGGGGSFVYKPDWCVQYKMIKNYFLKKNKYEMKGSFISRMNMYLETREGFVSFFLFTHRLGIGASQKPHSCFCQKRRSNTQLL
jgi:hypothetical protein